ncbi:hypothetical protein BCR37DRAFT_414464 [Protomyces lactucae-debilis]|uniref:Uncharacterized protein n=1 Tax=Protomyces lactucae-debilis TaxID=2754530 RepID=A0A1Y2F7M1_PROLT|nr:uncharacterized protein BCR37DRAFT_414464 [Protomyces lactucae-debilis]ORY79883.1 hypothetical protein BCR37DRAFT_414464 [Protomyces lactucae-debilis]
MRAPTTSQRRLVDELDTHGTSIEPLDNLYPYGPPPHRSTGARSAEQAPYHTRYNFLNDFLTRRVLNGARSSPAAPDMLAAHDEVRHEGVSTTVPIGTLRRSRTIRERHTKTSDETGSVQPLKLEMIDCDGGSLDFDSGRYMAENLLRNDTSVYCTAKLENVNILLKSAKPFVLTEMVIKAPQRSFTSPVKDGLIWVSMERPDLERTAEFDRQEEGPADRDEEMPKSPLQALLQGHDLPATTMLPFTRSHFGIDCPNAYFLVDPATGSATVKFEPPLSGRFVHVKLLSGQPFDSYPGRLERDNIDVQAVLLYGHIGPHLKAAFAFR